MTKEKLSIKLKMSYSMGQLTDSIPFNLFYIYFLFFFTDVVGMPPAMGGTISLVVILWDAFTDPIVGYLSDNSKSKYGRRRPFMLAALVPLFICTILLFTSVDFGPTLGFAYYLIVGVLFWTCYKFYVIPFFALGAELTQDFNDRNTLRTMAGYMIYIAVWLVSAGPMLVWDKVSAAGGSDQTAWVLSAIIFGGIGLIGGLICWNFTRGKEIVNTSEIDATGGEKINFFVHFKQLITLKPVRNLLLMILFMCISFSIASAALVYLMSNNLEMSESSQAFYWTCYTLMTFVILPICNFIANRIGKKRAMISLSVLGVFGGILYFIIGIDSFAALLGFTFLYQMGNVPFWTLGYSLTYDCCEVDEFVYGKRREGSITGFASFAQKLGSAIGMWVSGILLTIVGYDGMAATQTAGAEQGILMLNTLFPGILVGVGIIFLIMYPINSKNFEALKEATRLKREGKAYSDDEFKKIL